MNLNRRALLFIGTGLLLALAAIALFSRTDAGAPPASPVVLAPTPLPGKSVVVAALDIAANTVITNAQLLTVSYPLALLPVDAITDTRTVVGSTAKAPIFSGQVLLARQFAPPPASGAAATIPPGKLLVAFPATDMLNATGAIQPGDHVDILLTMPVSGTVTLATGGQTAPGTRALVSQGTLQDITVAAIGAWTANGTVLPANGAGGIKVVSFIVDHQQALILKFVKDSGGTIDIAVRAPTDNQPVHTDPVTADYLLELFNFK